MKSSTINLPFEQRRSSSPRADLISPRLRGVRKPVHRTESPPFLGGEAIKKKRPQDGTRLPLDILCLHEPTPANLRLHPVLEKNITPRRLACPVPRRETRRREKECLCCTQEGKFMPGAYFTCAEGKFGESHQGRTVSRGEGGCRCSCRCSTRTDSTARGPRPQQSSWC